MGIYVQESYVNATESHGIGESDVYETFADETGELFRAMRSEYGRCVGSVHIDTDEGVKRVGWVFQGRDRYQDDDETYLREVWVTLHERMPEVTTTVTYRELT